MRYRLIVLTLLIAACGDDGASAPETPSVEGQWNGPTLARQ